MHIKHYKQACKMVQALLPDWWKMNWLKVSIQCEHLTADCHQIPSDSTACDLCLADVQQNDRITS